MVLLIFIWRLNIYFRKNIIHKIQGLNINYDLKYLKEYQ